MKTILLGAGKHCEEVIDALPAHHDIAIYSDDFSQVKEVLRLPVLGPMSAALSLPAARFLVCFGENAQREIWHNMMLSAGHLPLTLIHPNAHVSLHAKVGQGVYVGPFAVVHPRAKVEDGAIVYDHAVVDRRSTVGRFARMAPGAILGCGAMLDPRAFIGYRATVLPDLVVGADSVIGAGAVVTRDMRPAVKAAGIPARVRS